MYKDLKEFIKYEFDHIKVDKRFCRKISEFLDYWWYKKVDDTDHSEFLGSGLIGTNRIIFSTNDVDKMFKDILQSDITSLDYEFKKIPGIDPQFKTTSNPFYLTIVCLMYMVNSSNLDRKDKEQALKDLYYIISVKFLSSILNNSFKYKPSPAAVKSVYERLNNKFLIKRLGNWTSVIEFKSAEVLPKGAFDKQLNRFTTDDALYMIMQISGGYRSMIKNIYRVLLDVVETKDYITNSTMVEEGEEGIEQVKDMMFNHSSYITYIKSIINSYPDFYKESYISLIKKHIYKNIDEDHFSTVITNLTELSYPKEKENDYVEKILVSSFNYLTTKGITNKYETRVMPCLNLLKGYWASGKIKEPMAREAKEMSVEIVSGLLNKGNKNTIPPLAMGLCVYIFLRAIAMKK